MDYLRKKGKNGKKWQGAFRKELERMEHKWKGIERKWKEWKEIELLREVVKCKYWDLKYAEHNLEKKVSEF